ncbi:hypothetical protein [uncultured Microscilla sp.]|uniref:hypothetical protein n=1 Tax=uncultured Microscilla sp. TaxID=432653 RepID=UPI002619C2F3|nr:hypothetical protein [uncultured Microscilla sp.]
MKIQVIQLSLILIALLATACQPSPKAPTDIVKASHSSLLNQASIPDTLELLKLNLPTNRSPDLADSQAISDFAEAAKSLFEGQLTSSLTAKNQSSKRLHLPCQVGKQAHYQGSTLH